MNMEPYVVCKDCGEETSTIFSYCRKCGAELALVEKIHQSTEETILPTSKQKKTDNDSIEEELNLEDQKCITCGKIVEKGSKYLYFCSEKCDRNYPDKPEGRSVRLSAIKKRNKERLSTLQEEVSGRKRPRPRKGMY